MRIGNMEITLREFLLSIVILFIMGTIGFIVSTKIHDYITEKNIEYYKALKIDDNADLFTYSIKTEVGDVLAYGEFKADKPVSDELIKGNYSAIKIVEEHYEKKTRTKRYKCGERTCTKTVTYWEWDAVGEEVKKSPTFTFLTQQVNNNIVNGGMYKRHSTVKTSSTQRFIYNVIPIEFKGSLFTNTKGKVLNGNKLYYEESVNDVIESKKASADISSTVFWVLWILITIVLVGLFYYMDNRWLHK